MIYCCDLSSKIPQISMKTVLGFTKSVRDQWIHKRKANDWTYQDTLSPESLSSQPTAEYIKMMPRQSKQGKDDVIIGPGEIGDGPGHRELRSQRQTRLQTWKLAPASSLKTQLYKSEREREEGECVSQQCWPDGSDIILTERDCVMNYQTLLSDAY